MNELNELTDSELAGKYLKDSNEKVLEELIGRYLPLIFGYVKKYTGNPDNASDITQEVFVKVWQNLKRYDQAKSFRTWIFTIAKRTAIDWLKKKNALPFSMFEKEGFNISELARDDSSVWDILLNGEASKEFSFALNHLPAGYGKIINLHVNHGFNFREISEFLKEPLNTIKSRYRRGILLLKEKIKI